MFNFTYVSEPPNPDEEEEEEIIKLADHVPFEVKSEIVKRLPVKSMVQCRSVSKSLKSLIDSPQFLASYHTHTQTHTQHQQHHLFVIYMLPHRHESPYELQWVSIVDDGTFPNQKSSLTILEPVMDTLEYGGKIHSVKGLLCYHNRKLAILWNPTIQKSVCVKFPNPVGRDTEITYIGFGARPDNSDPMLVRIDYIGYPTGNAFMVKNWKVEVFVLSTRVWKIVSNVPPAFKTFGLMRLHVCIDGVIYWIAYDTIKEAAGITSSFMISFDLEREEFGEVSLPNRLVHTETLVVSKVYESLGLFEYYNQGEAKFCDVWIMKEDGVSKSFIKMLSIKALDSWVRYRVLGLRKNGEAIVQSNDNDDNDDRKSVLQVYDTSSGSISCVLIDGGYSYLVNSYMETLLLLDETESSIH